MQLSSNLSENLAAFNTMFGPSADYYAKQVTVGGCPAAILLFDGMTSLSSLWTLLLDSVDRAAQFGAQPPAGGRQAGKLVGPVHGVQQQVPQGREAGHAVK